MINKLMQRLPMISCQVATRLMSEAMDRRLSFKETFDLRLHLMVCGLCLRFLKQVRGLRKILRSYQPRSEIRLSSQAKTQIKQALQANG